MKINLEDYVSEEEIKEAAMRALRLHLSEQMKDSASVERILTNCAYRVVWKKVDEIIDEDIEDFLSKKIKKICSSLTSFSVFKKPDTWDREPNAAYSFLQKCIEDGFPLIEETVRENIETETIQVLKDDLSDHIYEAIQGLFCRDVTR